MPKTEDKQMYWPFRCTFEEHKKLKMYALQNDISMSKAIQNALEALYLKSEKKDGKK